MLSHRSFIGLACRAAALTFALAGTSSLVHAQSASASAPSFERPSFVASAYANPFTSGLASSSSSSSSSSSNDALNSAALDSSAPLSHFDLSATQPPPRRTYGRPNYSDSNTNSDGSPKWTFLVGGGFGMPVGDTHYYETTGWGFQAGGGRNFSKTLGVLLQFDYDHFGLQNATVANEQYIYNYCTTAEYNADYCAPQGPAPASAVTPVGGNNHIWSFTLNPTFSVPTSGSLGAYAVVGVGFYHKVTNFTTPSTEEYCYYFCEEVEENATFDHYTSNALGVNGGLGVTWKFSKFSNEMLYGEIRYVFVDNQPRSGVTTANVASAPLSATDFYPANSHRTTYFPVKFGIRF